MAKSSTSFKPGQSGNPTGAGAGRPPHPPEINAGNQLTKASFNATLNKYLHCNAADLELIVTDPKIPVIDMVVCKILLESGNKGDHVRLNFLIERLLGKVKEEVEISLPKPTIIQRSDGTEIELGAKMEEIPEKERYPK